MHCTKKIILKCLVLLIIFKLSSSHQVVNAQNVTNHRSKRMYDVLRDQSSINSAIASGDILTACPLVHQQEDEACKIDVKLLNYAHSLLIDPMNHTEFRYPDENGFINMFHGEPIFLSCPGNNNTLKNYPSQQSVTVTCDCETVFKTSMGSRVDFRTFVCERPPENTVVSYKANVLHDPTLRKYEVGFFTDANGNFLKLITVVYNDMTTSTQYVRSVISKSIAGKQNAPENRRFDQARYCEYILMDKAYEAEVQDESFGNQLICHLEKKCDLLNVTAGRIFNPGHLTSKSTFVYTTANVATFKYLNTSPQWRPINGGNWARIEEYITLMASKLKEDLVVITGVLDNLSLVDTSNFNMEKFIHLYNIDKQFSVLQVPLYFYKLIYEPKSKRGVVYVTVNNPFLKMNEIHNFHICRNPMTKINGGEVPSKWRPKYIPHGYSYICEVPDFLLYNYLIYDDSKINEIKDLLYEKINTDNYNKVINTPISSCGELKRSTSE